MQFELVDITTELAPVLDALLELYQYDFTEFTGEDVGADGRFGNDLAARYCGGDPVRFGVLLRIDGRWAGLTLLHRGAFSTDDADCMDIVEFFVMRKYRRQGAGEAMATAAFERFPGRWEARVLASNVPALAFWRSIIERYTGGRYEERVVETWPGPVLYFESPGRAK